MIRSFGSFSYFRAKNMALYENEIKIRKGIFTMLDIIVFSVTLVFEQLIGGFIMYEIMMARVMSPKYLKKMSKRIMEASMELVEEMEDKF